METARRYDLLELLQTPTKDSRGFLTAPVVLARPGVFPYILADGALRREFKPPEEILSADTARSAGLAPVTDGHHGMVTCEEPWRVRGFVHPGVAAEDGKLKGIETIFDADLIREVEAGEKRQVSIGFIADIDPTPGEWNGEPYDVVQRNIRINHLAHVPEGRCGATCQIQLGDAAIGAQVARADSGQITGCAFGCPCKGPQSTGTQGDRRQSNVNNGIPQKAVQVGSTQYDCAAPVADHIAVLEASLQTARSEKEALAGQVATLTKEKDTLQGQFDAQKVELAQAKTDLEAAKAAQVIPADKVDALIEDRLSLVTTVKSYLGDEFDPKGKSNRDLKVALIQLVDKEFDPKDRSDEYVDARFDGTVRSLDALLKQDVPTGSVGPNNMRTLPQQQRADITQLRAARQGLYDQSMKRATGGQ